MVHIDAEDFSEQLVDVLRKIVRIIAATAITHSDVEIVVGAEFDHAAIVIHKRLWDDQKDDCR